MDFMKICHTCKGEMQAEEQFQIGHETIKMMVDCGCERGMEIDYEKLNSEIRKTESRIKQLKTDVSDYESIMRKSYIGGNKTLAMASLGNLVESDIMLEKSEMYLEELESFE